MLIIVEITNQSYRLHSPKDEGRGRCVGQLVINMCLSYLFTGALIGNRPVTLQVTLPLRPHGFNWPVFCALVAMTTLVLVSHLATPSQCNWLVNATLGRRVL